MTRTVLAGVDPWAWHAHPDVWALMVAIVGGYLVALTRLSRRRAPGEPVVSRANLVAFAAGIVILELATDWPLHDLGERYLFSMHMVQHTLISFVVPPLLLLAIPGWLFRILTPPPVARVLRTTARPIPATLAFNGFIAISHWPKWIDFTLFHHGWHFWAHVALFTLSINMWLPVVNRRRELPRLSPPGKMVYLFVQSIVPTVPAAFLAFAEKPMFHFYEFVPRAWGLSVVEDQQLAGAIMKVGGSGILWGSIIVIFFRWYAATGGKPGNVLTWDDVERQFERAGSAPRDPVAPL